MQRPIEPALLIVMWGTGTIDDPEHPSHRFLQDDSGSHTVLTVLSTWNIFQNPETRPSGGLSLLPESDILIAPLLVSWATRTASFG